MLVIAAAGCGVHSDRLQTHPVEGTVRFNGMPTEGATIVFTSVAAGKSPIIAEATVYRDGKYALSTYENRDGAPVGDYVVTLVWPEVRKGLPRDDENVADRLRDRYATPKTTTLKATVRAQANTIDFTLP